MRLALSLHLFYVRVLSNLYGLDALYQKYTRLAALGKQNTAKKPAASDGASTALKRPASTLSLNQPPKKRQRNSLWSNQSMKKPQQKARTPQMKGTATTISRAAPPSPQVPQSKPKFPELLPVVSNNNNFDRPKRYLMPLEHEFALPLEASSDVDDDFDLWLNLVNNAPVQAKPIGRVSAVKKERKMPSHKAQPNYVALNMRGGGGYRGRGKSSFRGRGRKQ